MYPVCAAQKAPLPFVIYTLSSSELKYYLGGQPVEFRKAHYTFGIEAYTESEILDIYNDLVDIIDGYGGTIGTTLVNEITVDDVEDELIPKPGGNQAIMRYVYCTVYHSHDLDVSRYTFTDEGTFKDYLQVILDNEFVPS